MRRGCPGRGSFCTDTTTPRSARIRANAFTRSSDGRVNGMPAASLSGSRLTLALMPSSSRTSRRASSGVSLTPSSRTYSNVIRRRLRNGNFWQASMSASRSYLRLIGTSRCASRSVVACSEIARFGISGSFASRFECRHHADRRQRHALGRHARPCVVGQDPQRLHRGVVVVQRLAHAHQHDVERRVGQACLARQHADLSGDLAGGEVPDEAHLAGETERAGHRAADLRRDAERLRRRVGDVDGFDPPAVLEAQQELRRAVGRGLARVDRRRVDASRDRRAARGARGRGRSCRAKSVTPRRWIQWKIWRPWKRRHAEASASAVLEFRRDRIRARFMTEWKMAASSWYHSDLDTAHKVKPVNDLAAMRRWREPPGCRRWSLLRPCRRVCGSSPRRCRTSARSRSGCG